MCLPPELPNSDKGVNIHISDKQHDQIIGGIDRLVDVTNAGMKALYMTAWALIGIGLFSLVAVTLILIVFLYR
jgi:hypothetical protein